VRVAILAVGDELLSGDVTDATTAHVARALAEHGIRPVGASLCGDAENEITAALAAVTERADAVVLTGGLGSTSDDRTRDALAAWAGAPLERSAALVTGLERWYAVHHRATPAAALCQADVPRGAVVLPNPTGSAPGLCVRGPGGSGRATVWALPGVPGEMRAMFAGSVLPALLERAGADAVVHTRGLRIALARETTVAALLRPIEGSLPAGVSMSYLPERGELRVRVTARARSAADAAAAVTSTVERVRVTLGDLVVGTGEQPLDVEVHRLLRSRGHTVAAAESVTGGLLGAALTAMPGSSATFRGGITAYATGAKSALLGVDPGLLAARGPVDPQVALAMARGARDRLGASHAVSTTGVAGPAEQNGRAPGTVYIGLCGPAGERLVALQLIGDRERIRHLSVVNALDALRRLVGDLAPYDAQELDRRAAHRDALL
jgi:nicotinamide-nucleotide amidase